MASKLPEDLAIQCPTSERVSEASRPKGERQAHLAKNVGIGSLTKPRDNSLATDTHKDSPAHVCRIAGQLRSDGERGEAELTGSGADREEDGE